MKKVKFTGKLSLNKETIARLNDEQMNVIKGGDGSEEEALRPLSWFRCCRTCSSKTLGSYCVADDIDKVD